MTTVIDPAGTPVPVYNRSGTTIVDVAAAGGTPPITRTTIPHLSGHTVAYVVGSTFSPAGPELELPVGAEVGDVVEVYIEANMSSQAIPVFPPSGDTFFNGGGASATVNDGQGRIFRKVSSTVWVFV